MDKRIIAMFMVLIAMTSMAFAAVTVTSTAPTTNEIVYGSKSYDLTFTLLDGNTAPDFTYPGKLSIYWSVDSNTRKNLIVTDSNIFDNTTVTCTWGTSVVNDRNLGAARTCTYSWSVPNNFTIPAGKYYVDYNQAAANSGAGSYQYSFGSSARFDISHQFSTGTCSLVGILSMVLVAALLVGLVVAGMLAKNENVIGAVVTLAIMAITVLIIMVIIGVFQSIVCAV